MDTFRNILISLKSEQRAWVDLQKTEQVGDGGGGLYGPAFVLREGSRAAAYKLASLYLREAEAFADGPYLRGRDFKFALGHSGPSWSRDAFRDHYGIEDNRRQDGV